MRRAFVLLLLLLVPARAAVAAGPEWAGSLGGTFAAVGSPDGRAFDASLAALWPVEERFSLGVMVCASDLGVTTGHLADTHSGEDLGKIEQLHRAIYGVAWRLDARVGSLRGWDPFASASWGFYSINDELHGDLLGREASTGFSLGGGLRHSIGTRAALGASMRYHRLFNDRVGRYMSAAVDWSWRPVR